MEVWQIHKVANTLQRLIMSVYLNIELQDLRRYMNRLFYATNTHHHFGEAATLFLTQRSSSYGVYQVLLLASV